MTIRVNRKFLYKLSIRAKHLSWRSDGFVTKGLKIFFPLFLVDLSSVQTMAINMSKFRIWRECGRNFTIWI